MERRAEFPRFFGRLPGARECYMSSREPAGETGMGMEVTGIFGFLILVADVYAIVKTFQSGMSTGGKVAWIVAIVLLPLLGVILWFLFARKN
jgi:hypothetical protein